MRIIFKLPYFLCALFTAPMLCGEDLGSQQGFISEYELKKMCGVNAAYIAMRLEENAVRYSDIKNELQPLPESTVSIADLERFIKRHGTYSRTVKLVPGEISKKKGNTFIVYFPPEEWGQTGHFVAMRVTKAGDFQMLDPLYGAKTIPFGNLGEDSIIVIELGSPALLPFNLNAYGIAGIAILAGALLAALLAKLYGKKK